MGRIADLLDSLASGRGATTLRGFGEGATMGVIKYPQAALTTAINGGTYEENLKNLRETNTQLAQDDPLAWYGGEAAGSVATGALTGGYGPASRAAGVAGKVANLSRANSGAKVLGPIATNAIMGGVQGVTEKDYTTPGQAIQDTLVGAGTSGAIGALGEGVRIGIKGLGRAKAAQLIDRYVAEKGVMPTERQIVKTLQSIPTGEIIKKSTAGTKTELKEIAGSAIRDAIGGAGAGGAAGFTGAILSNATGNTDINPMAAAVGGASTGAIWQLSQGKSRALQTLAGKGFDVASPLIAANPLWVSTPIRTAVNTIGPKMGGTMVSATNQTPTADYVAPQNHIDEVWSPAALSAPVATTTPNHIDEVWTPGAK